MTLFVIGNIIALVAAVISSIIGYIKNRQKVIYVQTFQFFLFTTSTLLLGGFTGAIANFIGAIRNIRAEKEDEKVSIDDSAPQRRVKKEEPAGRRTTPKYNVVNKEEEKAE